MRTSSRAKNAAIGVGLIVVISALGTAAGGGIYSVIVAFVAGAGVWFALEIQANNRQVKTASDQERTTALASPPPEGMALLYVYREGFMGKQLGFDVLVDGQPVAQLKSPRFVRLILVPGEHSLTVGTTGFAASQNKTASTSLLAAAGETVILKAFVQRGMAQNVIQLEREPDLVATLGKLALIPMVLPEQEAKPRVQVGE